MILSFFTLILLVLTEYEQYQSEFGIRSPKGTITTAMQSPSERENYIVKLSFLNQQ